jgi:hypothetical protein
MIDGRRELRMVKSLMTTVFVASLAATGCTTQTGMLDAKQDKAMQTALGRGKFELNCPGATATIISREVTQPALRGPWGGLERAEYTVGIDGCGQRHTYVVICPEGGESCYAAGSDDFRGR